MADGLIRFFEESRKLRNKRMIRAWIAETIAKHRFQLASLNIVLVDDERIGTLNETYLNHKGPTDVITFQYNTKGEPIDGEIFIGTETVKANAKRFAVSFERELHRVMIHGLLHLLGYSDKTSAGKKKMTEAEDRCLSSLHG